MEFLSAAENGELDKMKQLYLKKMHPILNRLHKPNQADEVLFLSEQKQV